MSWAGEENFTAYDQVEASDNYRSAAHLEAYRAERLARCAPYVELAAALGVPVGGFHVLDVGSGSAAFLYALEQADLLAEGTGVELSASRHAFANRWQTDAGWQRVVNIHGDVIGVVLSVEKIDLVTVLDDTWLYLRAEHETYPRRLAERAFALLRPGGCIVIDVRNDVPLARELPPDGRTFRVDLPPTNAFRHAVYRQEPSADRRALRNESTYFADDGRRRRKVEITEVLDGTELRELLEAVGFVDVALYGTLAREPYDAERSPRLVVTARRPGHPR